MNAIEALVNFEKAVREDERKKWCKPHSSSTFDNVLTVLSNHRQKGSTTALVAIAKINPKALIVTGNYSTARIISNGHGLNENQVTSLASLLNMTYGRDIGPLLFDLTAVMTLIQTIKKEVENG